MTHLEPGEWVETDRGYCGNAPKYVKCPDGLLADPDPAVKLMAARVWSWQETVNEGFKNWAILCTPYHHKFLEHQTVVGVIVVLTQLSLAANPLFHVEYNDKSINFIILLLLFIFCFIFSMSRLVGTPNSYCHSHPAFVYGFGSCVVGPRVFPWIVLHGGGAGCCGLSCLGAHHAILWIKGPLSLQ